MIEGGNLAVFVLLASTISRIRAKGARIYHVSLIASEIRLAFAPARLRATAVSFTVPAPIRALYDSIVTVHSPRFHPLYWAQLRDNSCARQLRVFCFSGSSQQIF